MRNVYEEQLAELNNSLIQMGALCEDAITTAIQGLLANDPDFSKRVAEIEMEIDSYEESIERLCMRLLLMQQPVASDLRKVSSALKMISDLERIGDQAYDISDITRHQKVSNEFWNNVHIREMAEAAIRMVTDSVDAYVKQDLNLAQKVAAEDDLVDSLFVQIRGEIATMIEKDRSSAEEALDVYMIAKYLERIGDHAVNVSEWVVYAITGEHVRH